MRKLGELKLPPREVVYKLVMARSNQILKGIKEKEIKSNWVVKKMKPKNDEFHYHEVLDRTHVLLSTWEEHINEHQVVFNNEELKSKSEEIMDLIGEFYQLISNVEEENESK